MKSNDKFQVCLCFRNSTCCLESAHDMGHCCNISGFDIGDDELSAHALSYPLRSIAIPTNGERLRMYVPHCR